MTPPADDICHARPGATSGSRWRQANKVLCMPKYPDIEPYETGLLDTGDGNLVDGETCGNP